MGCEVFGSGCVGGVHSGARGADFLKEEVGVLGCFVLLGVGGVCWGGVGLRGTGGVGWGCGGVLSKGFLCLRGDVYGVVGRGGWAAHAGAGAVPPNATLTTAGEPPVMIDVSPNYTTGSCRSRRLEKAIAQSTQLIGGERRTDIDWKNIKDGEGDQTGEWDLV